MQEPFQELNAGIVAADDTLTDGITEDEFLQFRQKCHRFRVLVIGSSDVGKTTLLERFTGDSIDRAQIKSPNGELLHKPPQENAKRGSNNIRNEITFPSRPGLVFHDAKGFEAGLTEAGDAAVSFLEDVTNSVSTEGQIHAAWFCASLAASRNFSKGVLKVLQSFESKVPTMVVFTKKDLKARRIHGRPTSNINSAEREALNARVEDFALEMKDVVVEANETAGLDTIAEPGLRFAMLGGIHENTEAAIQECKDLMQLTENAIPAMSRLLLTSVYTNNIHSRIRFVIRSLWSGHCFDLWSIIRTYIKGPLAVQGATDLPNYLGEFAK